MNKKKKIIVLSCMIALLAVTAVFNFIMTTESTNLGNASLITDSDYFEQYRQERLTNRNDEILQLDGIIASLDASSNEYLNAVSLKTDLTRMTEQEMLLESLIKAYGFDDVVVVMGIESDNVNVIAKSTDMTSDDAILIYSIISEENIASPENVKIIPIS